MILTFFIGETNTEIVGTVSKDAVRIEFPGDGQSAFTYITREGEKGLLCFSYILSFVIPLGYRIK